MTRYERQLQTLQELTESKEIMAALYPDMARGLSQPDVDVLLKTWAFLLQQAMEELEGQAPEFTHSLLENGGEHQLRPIPARATLQFTPLKGRLSGKDVIPRGTAVASVPIEGTRCLFKTCFEVAVYPITITDVVLQEHGHTSRLTWRFRADVPVNTLDLDSLRLYLHGEPALCHTLYLWLCQYLEQMTVRVGESPRLVKRFTLPPQALHPVGFADDEGLLPYPANIFPGYRLLEEYYAFPEKFHFVEVAGLRPLADAEGAQCFDVTCTFTRPLPRHLRVTPAHMRLFCTPIVNLFPHDADPITYDHTQTEYPVHASGGSGYLLTIYTLDRVRGVEPGSVKPHVYARFPPGDAASMQEGYRVRTYQASAGDGQPSLTCITLVKPPGDTVVPATEVVSIELTVTNGTMPERLRLGDITEATSTSPPFVQFQDISRLQPELPRLPDDALYWQLISNLRLNQQSLTNIEALRSLLSVYNRRTVVDASAAQLHEQQMSSLTAIDAQSCSWFVEGSAIRGRRIRLTVDTQQYPWDAGELHLFGTILNEFFALYATVNAGHQLVITTTQGEVYTWQARLGALPLL